MSRFRLGSCGALISRVLPLLIVAASCSPSDGGAAFFARNGDGGTTGVLTSGTTLPIANGGVGPSLPEANGGTTTAATSLVAAEWPPEQCTGAIIDVALGAYCLGPPVNAGDATTVANDNAATEAGCGSTIWGIVRDFVSFPGNLAPESAALVTYASKDFGTYCCNVQKGMVEIELGADSKPVFSGIGATSSPQMMTNDSDFGKWYNDVEGFNIPHYVAFHLVDNGTGIFTFSAASGTSQYFPLDNAGWGNDENSQHNFSFTTEIHTRFLYRGGEVFSFTGDDDLWVFINGQLAIDIGGVHGASTDSIQLDDHAVELGLDVGNVYSMDLFNAERHPGDSNFHIETSLSFVDCGSVPPPAVPQ